MNDFCYNRDRGPLQAGTYAILLMYSSPKRIENSDTELNGSPFQLVEGIYGGGHRAVLTDFSRLGGWVAAHT